MVPPSTAASFFPPNPEDGELWLPSYLCHEIAFTNVKPCAATDDNSAQPPPRHHAPKKKQVRDTLHGVEPNVKATIGNGQPSVDHRYNYPFFHPPLQFASGPFHPPNSITSPNQFLGYNYKLSGRGRSEGTGVFLPAGSVRTSSKKESSAVQIKGTGTGVFLNQHQVLVKPKKGGKNGKVGSEKKSSLKEETRANTKKIDESQLLSDQICLPQEWSY